MFLAEIDTTMRTVLHVFAFAAEHLLAYTAFRRFIHTARHTANVLVA